MKQEPKSKVEHALEASGLGLPVFALSPNGDRPAFDEGDAFPTHDKSLLRLWIGDDPQRNVGFVTDTLLAIHFSEHCSDTDMKSVRALFKAHPDTPETTEIVCKRPDAAGGLWFVFALPKGATVEGNPDLFAPGVGVVSTDNYLVGPGSRIGDREFHFANRSPIAPAPRWLLEMCGVIVEAAPVAVPPADVPNLVPEATDAVGSKLDATVDAVRRGSEPAIETRTDVAIGILWALDPTGRHDLVAIDPFLPAGHPNKIEAATFETNQRELGRAWIEARQGVKNLYTSVNRAAPVALVNWRLARKDIGLILAVVLDIDPTKIKGGDASGENFNRERKRLLELVNSIALGECRPTLVVDSGGGYQAWWQLADPMLATPENIAFIEGIGRTIQTRYDGDAVWDVARIMRLPGTVNVPSPDKAAQGRVPALASVLETSTGLPVTLEALRAWAPPTAARAKQDARLPEIDMDTMPDTDSYDELPKELRDKFDAARAKDAVLAALWDGQPAPEQKDISPSGFSFALAGRLKRAGGFTALEFGTLLRVWAHRSEKPIDARRIARDWGNNPVDATGHGFESVAIGERNSKRTTEPGATAAAPVAAEWGEPAAGGLATPLLQFDPIGLPVRPWIIPGFACRGRVTLLAGPGGVAKSTYYLMVAIAIVSGRGDICGFQILKRERVWVWNQEDDIAEMQRRVAAIMKAFDVSWDDLKDEGGSPMLFLDSGVDKPLMLANRSAEHSIVPGKQVADVIATVKANKIATIMLDPLVEFHEASENDNVQMRAVVGQVRRIAVEANCAAMLSTHTRKPPVASSDGFAGEMDAARGASAQLGVVRIGATIFSMSPKQAKEHRLAEGTTHLDYVRIDIAKNNLARVLPEPIWFKREGVQVGGGFEQNGESVGVLRPVTLDKKGSSASVHLPSVLAEVMATRMAREKHFKVSDVLGSATPQQQAMFGDKKHRAKLIADSFDGNNESQTEFGIITRTVTQGREMTLYMGRNLTLPQDEKTTGREVESEDLSDS